MAKEENSLKAWDYAYKKIKERILDLSVKPGQSISELTLSKDLGISRTPIREALRKLEQEGIIVNINGRKKVASLSYKDLSQIFDLKIAIEGYVAEYATMRKTVGQSKRLDTIVKRMVQFNDEYRLLKTKPHGALDDWLKLDWEFHTLLFEMSENQRAYSIIENLNVQWHRWRMGLLAMEGRVEKSITEHINIAQAVQAGKADEAKRLMVEHLEELHRTIINIASAFGLN
ncbi:GntR family transcriptional regulator [Breznakiella homolactica]|uniref:GntR family transcriptional regulator n=1 Tax=Breznakiella homolactica TaxID=2798577 RepID=A0A7T8BAL9_9SPIR|nr:GntR family transcriptional regulator [Breznakiella homolactica]QQO09647.1 GntR family transcriptional regulator [Breznakiella homolactica]